MRARAGRERFLPRALSQDESAQDTSGEQVQRWRRRMADMTTTTTSGPVTRTAVAAPAWRPDLPDAPPDPHQTRARTATSVAGKGRPTRPNPSRPSPEWLFDPPDFASPLDDCVCRRKEPPDPPDPHQTHARTTARPAAFCKPSRRLHPSPNKAPPDSPDPRQTHAPTPERLLASRQLHPSLKRAARPARPRADRRPNGGLTRRR